MISPQVTEPKALIERLSAGFIDWNSCEIVEDSARFFGIDEIKRWLSQIYTSLINFVPIRHFHISHNAPYLPPKFCITFVFHFSWVLQPSKEKLKTMLMQNFGEKIRCIWETWKWSIVHWIIHSNFSTLVTWSAAAISKIKHSNALTNPWLLLVY